MCDFWQSLDIKEKVSLVSLILQILTMICVIIAFWFDITLKRNIAKQSILHDWYKALVISKLDETLFKYSDVVLINFSEYQKNILLSDATKIKQESLLAVTQFHRSKNDSIGVLLKNINAIDIELSKTLQELLEVFEDKAIALMERVPLSSDTTLNIKFENLIYNFRADTIKILYNGSQISLNSISRTRK